MNQYLVAEEQLFVEFIKSTVTLSKLFRELE